MELSGNLDFSFPFNNTRIIPLKDYPGKLNMAIDYYFSKHIGQINEPIIRFYGWDPFCLSLGRHQDIKKLNFKKLQSDGHDVVRRPTGGSAIFHSDELTYSIVIPKDIMHHKELYLMMHQIIYRTLKNQGYAVDLQARNDSINYLKKGDATFICFNRSAYTEIKYINKKLVGSAQRIYQDAVLQHGSILIGSTQNKITKYFDHNNLAQKKNLKYLMDNSIFLDKIRKKKLSALQLSNYIIEEISGMNHIYQKPLTYKEIVSAKKYCSDFDVKNIY